MKISPEKIRKPKQWPPGGTKASGLRVRIEWETRAELIFVSGNRMPKTHTSLRGSQGRRTGNAATLNPYCGKSYPVTIPEKITGKAFIDPKGDFILKGEIEKPLHLYLSAPVATWEGDKLSDDLDRLQSDYNALEKEKGELSDELESIGDAASVRADKEELQRLEDAFDQIEQSISSFATSADIRPTTNEANNIDMLHEKYSALQNEVEDLTEDIRGLRVDNNALADRIFRQEQTIARLEEKLAAKEKQIDVL